MFALLSVIFLAALMLNPSPKERKEKIKKKVIRGGWWGRPEPWWVSQKRKRVNQHWYKTEKPWWQKEKERNKPWWKQKK